MDNKTDCRTLERAKDMDKLFEIVRQKKATLKVVNQSIKLWSEELEQLQKNLIIMRKLI